MLRMLAKVIASQAALVNSYLAQMLLKRIGMDTILIVDVDPERADLICGLLQANNIPSRRCQDVHEIRLAIEGNNRPAVIVAHCALVNYSFTELAMLRHHPQVKLIFYCTDAEQKSSGSVAKLPEELREVLLRITENKKCRRKPPEESFMFQVTSFNNCMKRAT